MVVFYSDIIHCLLTIISNPYLCQPIIIKIVFVFFVKLIKHNDFICPKGRFEFRIQLIVLFYIEL